jgi:hypothetical protein
MENYMIIRLFLIVLAVATLAIMVQRYGNLQNIKDSERFHDYKNAIGVNPVAGRAYYPSVVSALPKGEPLPDMPPSAVATPARKQIAREARAVAYEQRLDEDSNTNIYSVVESGESTVDRPDGGCFPKDKLTAEDLLPKEAVDSKWAQANPTGCGSLKDQNFLQAGYHVGLNTSQGAKRNGNLQLRSEPPAPKTLVSPWLNSDYEPDLLRKPFEINMDC